MAPATRRASLAERALSVATSEPLQARALAQRVLTGTGDFTVRNRVVAHRAMGVAARTQMQLEESLSHFGEALALAEDAGLGDEAALTRVSRAMSFGLGGRYQEALIDVDAAIVALVGQQQTEARNQKALILAMMGRFDEALAVMAVTVRRFHRSGNALWEARARANRSYVYLLTGAVEAGEREARAARALYVQLDHQTGTAYTDHHLAVLAGLRGDIPAALQGFEQVAAAYRRLGIPSEQGADAEVAILLAARLATDARTVATAALAKLRAQGNEPSVPELLLAVTQADLLLGDYDHARRAADDAYAWFTEQGLETWATLAAHLSNTARFGGGERSASLQAEAAATSDALRRHTWLTASLEAHLIAGQVAQALGDREAALASLRLAAGARHAGGLATRLNGWHAHALVEVLEGRPKSAAASLGRALNLVDAFRGVLGATELRAGAAGHAADLARVGLRLAFETGRATEIFKWSERYRAAALLLPPVRPPKDRELAQALSRLRSTTARLSQASPDTRQAVVSGLERDQRRLEREIRQLVYRAEGAGAPTAARPSATTIRQSLGDAVYVQIVPNDDRLYAVVVRRRDVTATALGTVSEVRTELGAVRFALRHLAQRPGGRSAGTMVTNLEYGTRRLDDLIFGPISSLLGARRLIISPPGELHLLPWSMLPTARGRLVTVAPSAATWLRAASQPPPRARRCALAAGPALEHADDEVLEIAGLAPGRHALVGTNATAAAVARALGGAALAHLACHGRFRADNPSFSSLQMFDGPLYVYDLERLRRPPHVIVLSACDSGQAVVSAGDELRGVTAALLALGTQAIIASVLPVRDDATRALMVDLHGHLATGAGPAAALALAQSSARASGSASAIAAAGSFTCFGAGWPVEAR